MPPKQTKQKTVTELIVTLISDVIRDAVKKLPTRYGDLLNFLADLIAVGALIFLWSKNMIPPSQILLSVGMLMTFMLLCFFGSWVMRRFRAKAA